MATIDVLIPSYGRKTALAITLTSLLGQTFTDFDVIVADQTEGESPLDSIEIATLVRALEWHGHRVELHRNRPRRGLAEQRQFLFERSSAPFVQYVDNDVLLDPPVMARMLGVLRRERCGFVGCPAAGLEYLDDIRPREQASFEVWEGPVEPELFEPDSVPIERISVNNAANPLHLEGRHARHGTVRYKVAWVGGANVLYDRAKLADVGAFSFWPRLPAEHAGEEVVVQWLLIRKYGGCGILPCGTYHLGVPTQVEDRRVNATELFGDLIEEMNVRSTAERELATAGGPRGERRER
ncbi:MAG TPA: glycosyltransferase family A protein [Chloroflexota bacterium]|nr:glycosyltransferase family A protein [Chloroflexota bacterium]